MTDEWGVERSEPSGRSPDLEPRGTTAKGGPIAARRRLFGHA